MSQLAFEPSFHPSIAPTRPALNGPVHHPQGYPQRGQLQDNQAFSHPGHQRQYYDGAREFHQAPLPRPTGEGMMQMQMHSFASPPPSNNYNTALHTPVPAQAPFEAPQNASATPPSYFSPNAASHSQSTSRTPPTKLPMAAPPLPQTPAAQQQPRPAPTTSNANTTVASPKASQDGGTFGREQQRIALLLSINAELFAEIKRLQELGHGGAMSPQQAQQLRNAGQSDKMASDDYIQAMRRVQANLAYLMPKAQHSDKVPPGPAHMTPPPHMPQLKDQYDQLKEAFPEWQGLDNRLSQSASGSVASPRSITQNGNANGVNASNASVDIAAL